MVLVHAVFDCRHERDLEVSIEEDVVVPPSVRGLGKCPSCTGQEQTIPISGVAPGEGGRELVLDSILMMPIEG